MNGRSYGGEKEAYDFCGHPELARVSHRDSYNYRI
jgi:hypothetical protein